MEAHCDLLDSLEDLEDVDEAADEVPLLSPSSSNYVPWRCMCKMTHMDMKSITHESSLGGNHRPKPPAVGC